MGSSYCSYSALEQFEILSLVSFKNCLLNLNNTIIFFLVIFAWTFNLISIKLNSIFSKRVINSKYFLIKYFFQFSKNLLKENIILKKNIFFYFLISLFLFLLSSNLVGLIPYAITLTSYISITLFCSGSGFLSNLLIGLRVHRSKFFSMFIPTGTPGTLKSPLVFIEAISYIARLFSLAIRLFANMMAGHALLKILSSFGWTFLHYFFALGLAASIVISVVLVVTILELLIAFLQSYVFVTLSSIYLNESVNLH